LALSLIEGEAMAQELSFLIVEDDRVCGTVLKSNLEDRGFPVTWIVGVKELFADKLIGICRDGTDIEILPGQFAIAFVDGEVLGGYKGWQIVPALRGGATVCIAASSSSESNGRMRDAGAQLTYDLAFVRFGTLLQQALALVAK
jgi:hypothetical protein